MGSPLGPVLADFFIHHLELSYLSTASLSPRPSFYQRYVDDIFCLFPSIDQSHLFLDYINSCHPNIKFSIEPENNNTLSFLDVSIT